MFNLVKLGIVAALILFTGFFSYQYGRDSMRASIAVTEQKIKIKEVVKVNEVIKYKNKIKVVYRDKIKLVKQAKDTTGCADIKLTDMGFKL